VSCEQFGSEYFHVDGTTYPINPVTCEPIGTDPGAWAFFGNPNTFRVDFVWVEGLGSDVTLGPQASRAEARINAQDGNGNGDGFADILRPNYLLWAGAAALGAFLLVRR